MFYLGRSSEEQLRGVDQRLERIVRRAIARSSVDFTVVDGVRTQAEQDQLVADGASKKRDSFHLTGHAVDLCPYIAGKLRWKVPPMLQVTIAVREAAGFFSTPVIWGGVWDRALADLEPTDLEGEIERYRERYRAARGPKARPFFDPWHFQVSR
jgi:peptidoglycan LD-endopeptidase CwlK